MDNFLSRIKKIADNEGIAITNLEQKIGASKGVLTRAMRNNTDIQAKWLAVLVENYPQYSCEWLLTGKGAVLKKEQSINSLNEPSEKYLTKDDEVVKELEQKLKEKEKYIKELKEDKKHLQKALDALTDSKKQTGTLSSYGKSHKM